MTIESLHLNKFLKLSYLDDKELRKELKKIIRQNKNKESGLSSGGGDFYMPFWSDVKNHVLGKLDLAEATKERIDKNYRRRNLYSRLSIGFLNLWERGSNQEVTLLDYSPKGTHEDADTSITIKIENIMAISLNGKERLGYPYWFSDPILSEEAARIGLWLSTKILNSENVRIFDIIRSDFFSKETNPLQGNEEELFSDHMNRINNLYEQLQEEDDQKFA